MPYLGTPPASEIALSYTKLKTESVLDGASDV
mgnify:CR=1 FL=1